MVDPRIEDAYNYVLDMLAQLRSLAKREGLEQLASRIETVVAAERADEDAEPTSKAQAKPPR